MKSGSQLSSSHRCAFSRPRANGRCVHRNAVQSPAFLGACPPAAEDTIQAIREAVAHSTCSPFMDLADDNTLIINPAWSDEPRTAGLSNAACGVTTDTKYADEYVRPIAASYETDGSVFLLWERRAAYAEAGKSGKHTEDICGVTYVKKVSDAKASVIATFRQPSPEEVSESFKDGHSLLIRPGSDNFFSGGPYQQDNPVCEQQMVAAVRQFYACWQPGDVAERLAQVADPKMTVKEPMWEVEGSYLPVNRVETAMWMERQIKNAAGSLHLEPKAIAHSEGTNMVFALWFAEGMNEGDTAGIHIFFFGDDLKINSLAVFREPSQGERKACLK